MTTSGVQVIGHGVDTLYLGAYVQLPAELLVQLEVGREALAAGAHDIPFEFAGFVHCQTHSGGGGRFKLKMARAWEILITPRKARDLAPDVEIRFDSEFLWSLGAMKAWEHFAAAVLPRLGRLRVKRRRKSDDETEYPQPPVIVTRADLCVDFRGWRPTPDDHENFVRRSRHVVAHFLSADAVRPPSAEEVAADEFERDFGAGRDFTGWMLGKGQVACRLYDKLQEILKSSSKLWMAEAWGLSGVPKEPEDVREWMTEMREADPVWRLEFQLKRKALREFGVNEVSQLWTKLGSLWRALAGDLVQRPAELEAWLQGGEEGDEPDYHAVGWLSLRIPSQDETRSRWTIHPAWRSLQESATRFELLPSRPAVRVRRQQMDEALALQQLSSALTRTVVLFGAHEKCRKDYKSALVWLARASGLDPVTIKKGGWEAMVEVQLNRAAAEHRELPKMQDRRVIQEPLFRPSADGSQGRLPSAFG